MCFAIFLLFIVGAGSSRAGVEVTRLGRRPLVEENKDDPFHRRHNRMLSMVVPLANRSCPLRLALFAARGPGTGVLNSRATRRITPGGGGAVADDFGGCMPGGDDGGGI